MTPLLITLLLEEKTNSPSTCAECGLSGIYSPIRFWSTPHLICVTLPLTRVPYCLSNFCLCTCKILRTVSKAMMLSTIRQISIVRVFMKTFLSCFPIRRFATYCFNFKFAVQLIDMVIFDPYVDDPTL